MGQENLSEMYGKFQANTVLLYRPRATAPKETNPREASEDQLTAAKQGDQQAWGEIC